MYHRRGKLVFCISAAIPEHMFNRILLLIIIVITIMWRSRCILCMCVHVRPGEGVTRVRDPNGIIMLYTQTTVAAGWFGGSLPRQPSHGEQWARSPSRGTAVDSLFDHTWPHEHCNVSIEYNFLWAYRYDYKHLLKHLYIYVYVRLKFL